MAQDKSREPATEGALGRNLRELVELVRRAGPQLEVPVARAARILAECLAAGGKVLACGNGGSAADAQHFVSELVGRMTRERRGLPALCLASDPSVVTSLSNDYGFARVFARQVEAMGAPGDALLAISTSGRSPNVLAALETAAGRGLRTIFLTGAGGASVSADACIPVPSDNTQRIQEIHIAVLHALCEAVEERLGLAGQG